MGLLRQKYPFLVRAYGPWLLVFNPKRSVRQSKSDSKTSSHGPYARTRKGYFCLSNPIPPYRSIMAKTNRRGDQGCHLQARQEGLQAIIDWCSSS